MQDLEDGLQLKQKAGGQDLGLYNEDNVQDQ